MRNSLVRAIQLWYITPALLHSPDGRMKRRQGRVSREWRHNALAPVDDCVHKAREHKAEECAERRFVAEHNRASTACRCGGGCRRSTHRSDGVGLVRQRGDLGHSGGQNFARRPQHRLRGGGGGGRGFGADECYRGRGRNCSPMVLGR